MEGWGYCTIRNKKKIITSRPVQTSILSGPEITNGRGRELRNIRLCSGSISFPIMLKSQPLKGSSVCFHCRLQIARDAPRNFNISDRLLYVGAKWFSTQSVQSPRCATMC